VAIYEKVDRGSIPGKGIASYLSHHVQTGSGVIQTY
jgi:hypothetical protein